MDLSKLSYQKPEGERSTSLIFVLSGGEKKEKDFLRELIRKRTIRSLRVAFMSKKNQGLQPYQMQHKWQDILKTGRFKIDDRLFNLQEMDKVFLLSDVDEFYSQLEKIIKEKSPEDYGQWIISNPCFEIWLYYCYLNKPTIDLSVLCDISIAQRSQELKSMGNTLVPGGLNPVMAFEKMAEGIENSKDHFLLDENGIPVLFATQMYEFAQYMIDKMNENAEEYVDFVKRNADKRNEMRNINS